MCKEAAHCSLHHTPLSFIPETSVTYLTFCKPVKDCTGSSVRQSASCEPQAPMQPPAGTVPRRFSLKPAVAMKLVDGSTAVVCSDAMHRLMSMVERVARQDAAVLIVGETGVGKEMIAQAIHHHSLRCGKSFIDVNCAAFPEHLVESELFGYEKGAFSGADATKPGLFELADQGTLFLDEVGELDAKVQAKLLRVLDGVPYYRLGGSRKVSVDVRVIAATNRDLEEEVKSGRFRRDLFHRLTQFQLRVPPLRERSADVPAIAEHLLSAQLPAARL